VEAARGVCWAGAGIAGAQWAAPAANGAIGADGPAFIVHLGRGATYNGCPGGHGSLSQALRSELIVPMIEEERKLVSAAVRSGVQ